MGAITVIAAVSTATGITVLGNLLEGKAEFDPIIGGFITGTLLLILAMFAGEVAGALALLILVSSLLMNADKIIGRYS